MIRRLYTLAAVLLAMLAFNGHVEAGHLPGQICDDATHLTLQAAVNLNCGGPRACKGNQDCATLAANRAKNVACRAARVTINNVCFGGGDAGHRIAVTEAENAIAKCDALLIKNACDNCPWL